MNNIISPNIKEVSETIRQDDDENEKDEDISKLSLTEKIALILRQKFKNIPEKELNDLANELAIGLLDAESRKHYALGILHRAKNYVHGYLKDYRIESEIQDKTYPLVLVVKIYF